MSGTQKEEIMQMQLLQTHPVKFFKTMCVVNLVGKNINVNSFPSQRLIIKCLCTFSKIKRKLTSWG